MSNYIPPNIVEKAKEIDLLTYFKMYEPNELVEVCEGTYRGKTHDSLIISNGLWYRFSTNDGGKNIKISQAIEVLEIQGEGSKRQIRTKSIGNFYNEALADLIAVYGSEDMNTKNCAYKQELVELKFLMNLENISMYTVLDDGLIGIINSYDSSLTNDLIEFIDNADATTTSEIIGKDYSGITAKDNIKNFSIVYGKSLKEKEDDTEIINKINKASMGIFEENELNEIMNEINKDTLIENNNSKDNLEKEDERE